MSNYFPPYDNSSGNITVELDLSNYATKDDVKNITHVDVSSYATKTNLSALKTEVDKIDTDKSKTVPDDLAKLSNVVKNDAVKKTKYNPLKNEVNAIDTSGFVTRTKFTTDTNALDDKIDKVENKIPDISGLATKSSVSLTAVENKIPDITSLIAKTDFDAKLKNISDRVANNKSKDLLLDNELKKLKTLVGSSAKIKFDEVQKEISFIRGFISYTQNSNLVYECKVTSMKFDISGILEWKPQDIYNPLNKTVLNSVQNIKTVSPNIKNINGQLYVLF